MRTVSKTSGTTLNPPTFELKGSLKRKKIGTGKIFEEIIVENFPNMGKELVNQVQEVQRVPYRIILRRNTRHILIKLSKLNTKKKY